MRLLLTCFVLGAYAQDDCGDPSLSMPSQAKDSRLDLVAKVVARDSTRMLVLAGGNDLSKPCSYDWWMSHEVQGTAECLDANKTAPPSFLQLRSREAGQCPPCVPDVSKLHGYFQTMAALSVLDLEAERRRTGHVLVIGLGAGLLPAWYEARTNASVQVVDYSDAVVKQSQCFGVTEGPRLSLHVDDGRKFLAEQPEASYDTLVVDAFDAHASMPVCMRSVEFFKLVASRLTDEGILLLNLLTCGTDQDPTTCGKFRNSVVASVQAAFPTTYTAKAPGTFGSQSVLMARRTGSSRPSPEAISDAALAEAQGWYQQAELQEMKRLDARPALDADSGSQC